MTTLWRPALLLGAYGALALSNVPAFDLVWDDTHFLTPRVGWTAAALGFFGAALGSKETAMELPPAAWGRTAAEARAVLGSDGGPPEGR